jgi:hypothetical protein
MDSAGLHYSEHQDEHALDADYLFARAISQTQSADFLFPPGEFRNKEKALLSLKRWYDVWIIPIMSEIMQIDCPPEWGMGAGNLRMNDIGMLSIVDSISVLIKQGCKMFQVQRFSEGGAYIRAGFVLVEDLLQSMAAESASITQRSPMWVSAFWNLLTTIPNDLSKALLRHLRAMAYATVPRRHPINEILECIHHIQISTTHEIFSIWMSSMSTDIIDEFSCIPTCQGKNPSVCLLDTFWLGHKNSQAPIEEMLLEFRRVEPIRDWQQRDKLFSFNLCTPRQLYHPGPAHKEVLTLLWLRRYVVDGVNIHSGDQWQVESSNANGTNEICQVKSAVLNRLELSLGEDTVGGSKNHLSILAADVFQSKHIHYPRHGEETTAFRNRHVLNSHGFNKMVHKLQDTHGIETEAGAWFKWLQILEGSLTNEEIQPQPREQRRPQSILSFKNMRGKGFSCDYMATQYGEIGINPEEETRSWREADLEGDSMWIHIGILQN